MDISRLIYRSPAFKTVSYCLLRLYRRALLMRADDDTARSEHASALVLAPHPDDETLGCGATILRKRTAGTPVHIALITDGGASHNSAVLSRAELVARRQEEAVAACGVLGVRGSDVTFLGYTDGLLETEFDCLVRDIERLIRDCSPEEILTPSVIDGHSDHRALNAATRRAVASLGHPVQVLEYPVWFWDPRSWVDFDAPAWIKAVQLLYRPIELLRRTRPRSVASGSFLEHKRAAISFYRSQLVNITGEPGWPILDPEFLEQFLTAEEIFFVMEPDS
jgi:LmbE family N-acetylglucosaminyl deacetylase